MLDHEAGQFRAIDKDNPFDRAREFYGLLGERRGRNEDALVRALTRERPVETLHFWPPDHSLPPLCLHVHLLEARAVQRDNAIDAAVTHPPTRWRSSRRHCQLKAN